MADRIDRIAVIDMPSWHIGYMIYILITLSIIGEEMEKQLRIGMALGALITIIVVVIAFVAISVITASQLSEQKTFYLVQKDDQFDRIHFSFETVKPHVSFADCSFELTMNDTIIFPAQQFYRNDTLPNNGEQRYELTLEYGGASPEYVGVSYFIGVRDGDNMITYGDQGWLESSNGVMNNTKYNLSLFYAPTNQLIGSATIFT